MGRSRTPYILAATTEGMGLFDPYTSKPTQFWRFSEEGVRFQVLFPVRIQSSQALHPWEGGPELILLPLHSVSSQARHAAGRRFDVPCHHLRHVLYR